MLEGGCHCGAVRYRMSEEIRHHALCHCADCRRHSGAFMVGWAMVAEDQLEVEGDTKEYRSSEHGRRSFCPQCGTGLFYHNQQVFPGLVDVQTATLDEPDRIPAQVQIQTAERIAWMEKAHELPGFPRYPG